GLWPPTGGGRPLEPARVTAALLEDLRDLAPLAPLHLPTDLAVIEAATGRAPGVPAVAVFDTAFHRTLPEIARRYALPDQLGDLVHRRGFHGIAPRFVAGAVTPAPPLGPPRPPLHT